MVCHTTVVKQQGNIKLQKTNTLSYFIWHHPNFLLALQVEDIVAIVASVQTRPNIMLSKHQMNLLHLFKGKRSMILK